MTGETVAGSVELAEVARFSALADRWWDPRGPMRELHRMNPARIAWIASRLTAGARVLDLGCGGGIASEALALAGFDVLGVDASTAAIAAAIAHRPAGLAVEYRAADAETLAAEAASFAAITALEVIEHVTDPAAFVGVLAGMLRPGGTLFISTINRTLRSLAVAKIGAEYVLRLLPAGTHQWRRFVTPGELAAMGRAAGLHLDAAAGMVPAPWRIGRDLRVNYIAALTRPV